CRKLKARAALGHSATWDPSNLALHGPLRSISGRRSPSNRRAQASLLPTGKEEPNDLSARQYARRLAGWLAMIGLDPCFYGTHSLRRTKATLIYKKTGNLRAVQLLLGHTKIESTVRYLGIEVDDALAVAEQIDV